jgi:hypothetical protein
MVNELPSVHSSGSWLQSTPTQLSEKSKIEMGHPDPLIVPGKAATRGGVPNEIRLMALSISQRVRGREFGGFGKVFMGKWVLISLSQKFETPWLPPE